MGNNSKRKFIYRNGGTCSISKYVGTEVKVVVPEGVDTICKDAFSCNHYIEVVILPESLHSIEKDAFYGCTNLKCVVFPSCIGIISSGAFQKCISLEVIEGLEYVTEVAPDAFEGTPYWNNLMNGDGLIYFVNHLVAYHSNGDSPIDIVIKEDTTFIDAKVFKGCTSINSVVFPDSLLEIGESAFFGCSGLTQVTLPKNLHIIEDSAFERCISLDSIKFNNSVLTIRERVFADCNLSDLYIPRSVNCIGDCAFSGSNIQSFVFEENSHLVLEGFALDEFTPFYGGKGKGLLEGSHIILADDHDRSDTIQYMFDHSGGNFADSVSFRFVAKNIQRFPTYRARLAFFFKSYIEKDYFKVGDYKLWYDAIESLGDSELMNQYEKYMQFKRVA